MPTQKSRALGVLVHEYAACGINGVVRVANEGWTDGSNRPGDRLGSDCPASHELPTQFQRGATKPKLSSNQIRRLEPSRYGIMKTKNQCIEAATQTGSAYGREGEDSSDAGC